MICAWVFDTRMGGSEVQKEAFHIIRVAKYEVSVFREKASKMRGKRDPKMIPKSSFGRSGVRFLSFGEFVGEIEFFMNL